MKIQFDLQIKFSCHILPRNSVRAMVILFQHIQQHMIKNIKVCTFQHDQRCTARCMGFYPATETQTPLVAFNKAGKLPLGSWRAEIISLLKTILKECLCHHGTHKMRPDIRVFRSATPIPKKTGHGIKRTGNQRLSKYISIRCLAHNVFTEENVGLSLIRKWS